MDTPMQDDQATASGARTTPEAQSTPAASSEASPKSAEDSQSASGAGPSGESAKPSRSTALATAARRNKKRKPVPDGRSKAVVCDQCRSRKTSCDLKDPCSACGAKGIPCSYERTDPVAREEKLQELEAKRQAREAALSELQQAAPPGHYDMNTRSGGRTRHPRASQPDYVGRSSTFWDLLDEADEVASGAEKEGVPEKVRRTDEAAGPGGNSLKPRASMGAGPDSGFASSATSSATAAARSKAKPALYRPGDENAPSKRHSANLGSAIYDAQAKASPGNDSLRRWIASRNEAGGAARRGGPPPLPPIDLSGRVRDSVLYHFPTSAPYEQDGPWTPGQPLPAASDAFDVSDTPMAPAPSETSAAANAAPPVAV